MNIFTEKNNKVYLSGKVVTKADFSHEVYGESFYEMTLAVERLSGQEDKLPITVSERLLKDKNVGVGSVITVAGWYWSSFRILLHRSIPMLFRASLRCSPSMTSTFCWASRWDVPNVRMILQNSC